MARVAIWPMKVPAVTVPTLAVRTNPGSVSPLREAIDASSGGSAPVSPLSASVRVTASAMRAAAERPGSTAEE